MRRLYWRVCYLLALAVAVKRSKCLRLSQEQLTNITASGNSFVFYSDDAIVTTVSASALAQESSLYLQNNSLTSIPVSFFQAANNATYIDISNNPLTKLETQSFVNMKNLQTILCTNTDITVLPNGLVSSCPLLQTVSFNQSAIRTVGSQAFVNLTVL
ncbi:TKL protein kinase, partial [Phytophthora megakarya]